LDLSAHELAEYGLNAGPTPGEDESLTEEAVRIWNEFALHQDGVTYAAQGYHLGDGVTLIARKIDEHRLVSGLYAEALAERRKQHGEV